jgi:hypothetical protein
VLAVSALQPSLAEMAKGTGKSPLPLTYTIGKNRQKVLNVEKIFSETLLKEKELFCLLGFRPSG